MPNPDLAEIVVAARAWLGTSWIHQGRLKGIGVDCGGLIIGVGKELVRQRLPRTARPPRPRMIARAV